MKHRKRAKSASFRARRCLGQDDLLFLIKWLRAALGDFSLLRTQGGGGTVETLRVPVTAVETEAGGASAQAGSSEARLSPRPQEGEGAQTTCDASAESTWGGRDEPAPYPRPPPQRLARGRAREGAASPGAHGVPRVQLQRKGASAVMEPPTTRPASRTYTRHDSEATNQPSPGKSVSRKCGRGLCHRGPADPRAPGCPRTEARVTPTPGAPGPLGPRDEVQEGGQGAPSSSFYRSYGHI